MAPEHNPADERRILDEISQEFKRVMENNPNAKYAYDHARQHTDEFSYVLMAVIANLDSVIRDLKDQLGEALERALPPGHFIAKDNSNPQQVWLWAGERDESAEPVCRLPIEVP